MQYQRKRNFIYRKDIKNIQNFRINRSNLSKTNDSTRDEETKNIKYSHPVKISKIPRYENIQYENIKEENIITEKKIININLGLQQNNNNIYNNNYNSNYNYERRVSSQKIDSDDNNIISLKIKNNKNNISNNSHVRYSSTSNYNNSNENSAIKAIKSNKEEYKTNSNESFISHNTNNYSSSYMRYKSSQKTIKKQINLKCYNNYNLSNKITPQKDHVSFDTKKQSIDNNINKSDLESINYYSNEYSKNNYSNKTLLRHNRKIDNNDNTSEKEFPYESSNKNKTIQKYDTLTYNDLKKISKKYNKVYDIDESDILIKDTKIILPGESNELINNKNKILSKMNRLSNILLSNNKKERNTNNSSIKQSTIEKNTKSNSSRNLVNIKNTQHSFYTLAKLKKKDEEDILIRKFKHRYNGGVVDLSSKSSMSKQRKSKTKIDQNDIDIEQSAKTIQHWWKLYRLIYINKIKRIIFIQSCWRGFSIRKHIFDKLYLNYIYITFCLKIKIILVSIIYKDAFKSISMYKNINRKKNSYDKLISIIDKIINIKKLQIVKEFWDKFYNIIKRNEKQINKGKILLQIKTNQEKRIKILYSAFITWAYKSNNNKYKTNEIKSLIYEKNKSVQIFQIIKVKYLLRNKTNSYKNVLRKYFYKWYKNILYLKQNLNINERSKKMLYNKLKLFLIIIEIMLKEHKKIVLRIFFKKIYYIFLKKEYEKQKIITKKNILKNIENNNEGCKLIEKFIYKNTYIYPLYCIMDKINNENIDINLIKIIRTKKKSEKEFLKDIFLIWKNKILLEKKNDIIKTLFIKIIDIYQRFYIRQLLIKKLYKWKSVCNFISIKTNSLIKVKNIIFIFDFVKITNIKINAKDFFYKLNYIKRKININDSKLLKKIIIYNNRKNNTFINQKAFNKWYNFIISNKILILKGKILLNIYNKYKSNNHEIILLKYFHKWIKNSVLKDNNNNKNNNKENIINENKESLYKIRYITLKALFRKKNRNYMYNNTNKYFRKWILFKDKQNEKNTLLILVKKIIEKNNQKILLLKNYYLKRWLFIANSIKMQENSKIIVNFLKLKIKNLLIQKKWNNIANKLKQNKNINNIITKIKYFKGFKKIIKIIKNQTLKISFKRITKIKYINISINKIKINIEKINNKRNIILLEKYLTIWRKITNKKILREKTLIIMCNMLKYNSIKNVLYIINNIFTFNKTINIVSKIESLLNKYNNNIMNENLIIKQKKYLISYLYKYKILNIFCNNYDKLIKNKKYIYMLKFILFLKSDNDVKENEYNYSNIIYDEKSIAKKINLKFHCSYNNMIRKTNNNDKKIRYIILILFFIKYMIKKINNRKLSIFTILKELSYSNKFCNKYIKFTNKEMISKKHYFIQNLKKKNIIKNKEIELSNNLYVFMRKSIIHKTMKILKKHHHFNHLLNIIKITIVQKKNYKKRYLLNIIKKWRFLTFLSKVFSKKMSLMYNDLHTGYMDLVKNIIDDTTLTKNDIDKMSRLDIKKYLYNFEDPLIVKNNELNNENKGKYYYSSFKKDNWEKNKNEKYNYLNIDDDINREYNIDNSLEKSISFIEKKFIKDNVNYLYNSYDDNSDFEENK